MADIVVGHRPFFKIDSQLAEILFELGFAKPMEKPPVSALPKVDTFGIGANKFGAPAIRLTRPDGSTALYDGDPNGVSNAFKSLVWSAAEQKRTLQGPEPPKEIKESYVTAHGAYNSANFERARQNGRS
jgi:hypothetical protein